MSADGARTWEELTEPLEPLARDLARIHCPDPDSDCTGCDIGDAWGAGYARWPCSTADVVLEHLGKTAADVRLPQWPPLPPEPPALEPQVFADTDAVVRRIAALGSDRFLSEYIAGKVPE